jgi:hypothetical protein
MCSTSTATLRKRGSGNSKIGNSAMGFCVRYGLAQQAFGLLTQK